MTKTTKQLNSIRHLLIALFLSVFTLTAVNAQMTAQWVQQAGTGGGTFGVSSDQTGNCYATGQITNPGLFDNLTITSGPNNIFIAKYDANGNVLWAKSAGGELLDQGNEIATDAQEILM